MPSVTAEAYRSRTLPCRPYSPVQSRHPGRLAARGTAGFVVPPADRVLVAIGALDPRKGHALIIEWLAHFLSAQEATLLIAGEGPEEPRLHRLVRALALDGKVRILGFVPDVRPILGCAD